MSELYNLTVFRKHLNSQISKKFPTKMGAMKEFNFENLINKLDLKKVSFTLDADVSIAVEENKLLNLISILDNKYGLSLDIDSIKEKTLIKNVTTKTYYISTQEDILLAKRDASNNPFAEDKLRQDKLLKIANQKKLASFSDIDFSFDYKDKKIVSFDFEYRPDVIDKNLFKNTFEVGISVFEKGKINSYHYIVEENSNLKNGDKRELQNSFNFGKSEVVSYKDLSSLIQKYINENELIVVHEHSNDLKILDANKIVYDKKNVKDTQYIYTVHFRKPEEDQHKSLKKLLNDHNIIYKNLHNAGNDSRFTLMLFKSMCKDYQSLKRKNNTLNLK